MKRFEKKYRIAPAFLVEKEFILIENRFRKIFKDRFITSIYYDTPSFLHFRQSEEGICKRRKIRIRYYNNDVDKAIIEYKNKNSEIGWKDFSKLENAINISSGEILNTSAFTDLNLSFIIPSFIENGFQPTLGINYLRRYYLSEDKQTRITFDKKIKFSSILKNKDGYFFNYPVESDESIMEVKFESGTNPDQKLIEKLTNSNNLNLSRFSKYCEGIKQVY
ncbi:VTC domain-containing protein [Prochlorococcus marinus XMU1406]|uniref:VTC domain-containing protein n=1 Tax=Prochlorococcus marinus TaxID=1219 RepID=UPI001ADA25AE|nr:VTC domain-containing protein [Prochlorococcus marinus]MBO8206805.1 VTC domain-containing protein [Prochlorococcus marinus XMU1406]MCR8542624.1 VTC domain-containing protein [Prochlorococcus marinus XMU1427]